MSLDTSALLEPDQLFVGRASNQHAYYRHNNLTGITAGKAWMHDAVEKLLLENLKLDGIKFMSLPGKYWRFESRLMRVFKDVHFTGFERDHKVILSGAAYVPREFRERAARHYSQRHGFRAIESLGVEYFKTNRARWLSMDVNAALTLNAALFNKGKPPATNPMHWFMQKFCGWDGCWLDYYGPASKAIGDALTNLHFYLRRDVAPVAVTILKGRESGHEPIADRRGWLTDKLSGGGVWGGVKFKELCYHEYTEEGSTMCNMLGLIQKTV